MLSDHNLKPGRYIVAVSGGVDSISLLHWLSQTPDLNLIVAHFDHGIRKDSRLDREFVADLAKAYRLPFIYDKAELGPMASEEEARNVRYKFLHAVRLQASADAIILAHHQDDQIETAIFNMLRGTNRKGVSALKSTDQIIRPLINTPKVHIRDYARKNNLLWREDPSNQDLKYSRNYIRHQLVPKLTSAKRTKLVEQIKRLSELDTQIDKEIGDYLADHSDGQKLKRQAFINLPHKPAVELMAAWLRANSIRNYTSSLLENLTIRAKTLHPSRQADIDAGHILYVGKGYLALKPRDR